MVMLHNCVPCQHGDHDGHAEVVQAAPAGMMGGWHCPCKGECRDRPCTMCRGEGAVGTGYSMGFADASAAMTCPRCDGTREESDA